MRAVHPKLLRMVHCASLGVAYVTSQGLKRALQYVWEGETLPGDGVMGELRIATGLILASMPLSYALLGKSTGRVLLGLPTIGGRL